MNRIRTSATRLTALLALWPFGRRSHVRTTGAVHGCPARLRGFAAAIRTNGIRADAILDYQAAARNNAQKGIAIRLCDDLGGAGKGSAEIGCDHDTMRVVSATTGGFVDWKWTAFDLMPWGGEDRHVKCVIDLQHTVVEAGYTVIIPKKYRLA